jgi:putative endonuclease
MYTTYIVFSVKLNKYYIGQTCDLNRRLQEHNRGKTKYFVAGIPWKIVYSKEFNTRAEAVNLEARIKNRGAARFLKDNNITVG